MAAGKVMALNHGMSASRNVEDRTEQVLLSSVLSVQARVQVLNLWQVSVEKVLRRLESDTQVFVVFDTDAVNRQALARFKANLNTLQRGKRLAGILPQTCNLEEELVRCCSEIKSVRELHTLLGAEGGREFKNAFCSVSNVGDRLRIAGFDRNKLWDGVLIPELKEFEKYRRGVRHLLRL